MPYWTERWCRHGHDTLKYGRTNDRFCKRCRQLYDKRKYQNRLRKMEIAAVKQVLLSVHRLRAVGVRDDENLYYRRGLGQG